MQGRNPKVNAGPEADVRSKPNAVNAGSKPDAGPKPKRPEADVRSKPNAVNAGSKPDAGPKPNEINEGPEPDAGLKPYAINAEPEPDVGSKPNAVNAGSEPDAGLKPDAGPKPDAINAGLIGKCKKCESKGEFPPSCGWPASSSSLSNLSVIEPSVGEVDHAVPEYTPSTFRGGSVRPLCAGGLCRGADSSGTQANSVDCCRRRVEGLHGGIARCMVRCYKDRATYGWGLPTQGCEFLEIERGTLGAGSVA
ncbi:hypothetical protein CRG98_019620 [Punica granatum]|uniref:Uncharacterized protein n=1 Tax=Punica granatum TaxID=22663 RepID=A0A2I0JUK4_PUNGR|nr:hypothetical protein CRG98_019620 [Punica granatum]